MADNTAPQSLSEKIQAAAERARKEKEKYIVKQPEGVQALDPGLTYRAPNEKYVPNQWDVQKVSTQRKAGGKISLNNCKVSTTIATKKNKNW